MTIEELKQKIHDGITENKTLPIFFVLKEENSLAVKRADFEQGRTTEGVKELFENFLIERILKDDGLELIALSAEDERKNVIYEYDYQEELEKLSFFNSFDIGEITDVPTFSFSTDSLDKLFGYLIYIGTMENEKGILLFKKHYPISLIKRDSFLLWKKDERLVQMEKEDIIRLNGEVQLIKVEGKLFILDLQMLEKYFGFDELVRKKATETINEIVNIDVLEDAEVLVESIEDRAFARKIAKVQFYSPIIQNKIPKAQIIEFSKKNPGLKGQFRYSEDGSKIRLDTKSSKLAFIKLLNDDYLISELSKRYYDSLAKNQL